MANVAPNKLLGRWVAISVVVVIVAFGGLSVATVQMARQTQWWVVNSQTVIAESNALLASMVDAETGERGFSITGDENYLRPYREAQANVPLHLGRLKELVTDNPAQQARLTQIEGLVQAKWKLIATALDDHRQGQSVVIDKPVMDGLRFAVRAFVQEENDLFRIRHRNCRRDRQARWTAYTTSR